VCLAASLAFVFFAKDVFAADLWASNTVPIDSQYRNILGVWQTLDASDETTPLALDGTKNIDSFTVRIYGTGSVTLTPAIYSAASPSSAGSWHSCAEKTFNNSGWQDTTFDCSESGATNEDGLEDVFIYPCHGGGCGAELFAVASLTNSYGCGGANTCHRTNTAGYNEDFWFKLYTTLAEPPDPRISPATEIIYPIDDSNVPQNEINAVGADAFTFDTETDVESGEYPDEILVYEMEIKNDADEVVCEMQKSFSNKTRTSLIDPTKHYYGDSLNHKTDGKVDPCPNFTLGTYTASARAEVFGNDWGEWGDPITFTVVEYSIDPNLDCPDEPSWFSLCWFEKILRFLVIPSQTDIDYLLDKINGFIDRFPISWVVGAATAVSSNFDQEKENLGSPDGGNPLHGELPNSAWWALKLRQFYGEWAAAATTAFIWFGVLIAIIRATYAILGIDEDLPFESG
jgi:hypothetical protein